MMVHSQALNSRPRSRSASRAAKIFLVVLTLLTVASALWIGFASGRSTDDAALEAHVVNLAPRVSGPVLRVLVEENQTVRQGQLLLEIDPSDYQVKLAQARANLRSAERRLQAARLRAGVARVTSNASLHGAQSTFEMGQSNIERARLQVETASRLGQSLQARVEGSQAQLRTARLALSEISSQARAARVEVVKNRQDLKRAEELVRLEASPRETLDHAQAAYEASRAQAEAAEQKIAEARARILEAEANARMAEQQWNQSQSQVAEARAHVAEVQAQSHDLASKVDFASAAPQQVGAARMEAEVAAAEVAAARATLNRAQLDLDYTRIYAPMNGRVSRRLAEPGTYAQVGQNLMAEVSHELWVVANFRETDLAEVRIGQKASITIDAYPSIHFAARVDSLQPGSGSRFAALPPENASGNWVKVVQRVPVKLRFEQLPGANYNLAPGMSVRATVE